MALGAALLLADAVTATGLGLVQGGVLPGAPPLFSPDDWWNVDISGAPVDPNSAALISFINGGSRRRHPDLGGEELHALARRGQAPPRSSRRDRSPAMR
jgi:hypothetical protein